MALSSIAPRCDSCRIEVGNGMMFRIEWLDGHSYTVCTSCCPTPGSPEYTVTALEVRCFIEQEASN